MDGLQHFKRIFEGDARNRRKLDRESLPDPMKYLESRRLLKRQPKAGKGAVIACPAHNGGKEKNPSLVVSPIDGHFRCMACGVSGGDLVSLHRLITGAGFIEAVRDLGGRFHA